MYEGEYICLHLYPSLMGYVFLFFKLLYYEVWLFDKIIKLYKSMVHCNVLVHVCIK